MMNSITSARTVFMVLVASLLMVGEVAAVIDKKTHDFYTSAENQDIENADTASKDVAVSWVEAGMPITQGSKKFVISTEASVKSFSFKKLPFKRLYQVPHEKIIELLVYLRSKASP